MSPQVTLPLGVAALLITAILWYVATHQSPANGKLLEGLSKEQKEALVKAYLGWRRERME